MSIVRVASYSMSLDGFSSGPGQSLEHPMGAGGMELHAWVLPTRTFRREVLRTDGGADGIDDAFAQRGFRNLGAWVLGRNMFGPDRGPWGDPPWNGWWGDDPPYHVPVFVLTHHPRPALAMAGGTVFHFVTGGMRAALDAARAAAGERDVRIGGGAQTVRQFLQAGLIDELHLAIAPVVLGSGERPFEGVDLRALGFSCVEHVPTEQATHVVLRRQAPPGAA